MKEQVRLIGEPFSSSRSTLLVPGSYFERYFDSCTKVRNLPLSFYLQLLLDDPQLEYNLSLLKTQKWKKVYQSTGQDLRRINFYPDERDWARLSVISNATGFSRCYIFVFLMLIDLGVISPGNGGTNPKPVKGGWKFLTLCSIIIDLSSRKLTRTYQSMRRSHLEQQIILDSQ